jgi:hypothetical protein
MRLIAGRILVVRLGVRFYLILFVRMSIDQVLLS